MQLIGVEYMASYYRKVVTEYLPSSSTLKMMSPSALVVSTYRVSGTFINPAAYIICYAA